jgi:hypothetical protein
MSKKFDLSIVSMALGIAGYLAGILDCFARNALGLSGQQILRSAVAAALLVALALAAVSLRKKPAGQQDANPKR